MPILNHPRDETFAQARAEGSRPALLDTARLHSVTEQARRQDQIDIIDQFGARRRAAAGLAAL